MSKSMSTTRSRLARAGIATGAVTTVLVAASATAAFAAALPMTLSQVTGPSGGLNTITGTVTPTTTTPAPFTSSVTPAVEFQTVTATVTACGATYLATTPVVSAAGTGGVVTQTAGILAVTAPNVKKISTSKLAITVPSSVVLTNVPSTTNKPASVKYNVCVYSGTTTGAVGTGSPLIANAQYTIAAKPTITAISPASGPALGGTTVTVTGTGFVVNPTSGTPITTVTVGGRPLTGVTVAIGAAGVTTITGVTPAATGTDLTVAVTSLGGRVISTDPDNDGVADDGNPLTIPDNPITFDYSNAISISPTTAPSDTSVDLDILGVGFLNMSFDDASSTSDDAHVYLVNGEYDSADNSGDKTVAPIAECGDVLPITDNELICTLNLAESLDSDGTAATAGTEVENGAYTVAVVSNGAVDAEADDAGDASYEYVDTELTSGATFTVAPY